MTSIENDALMLGVGFVPNLSMRRYAGDFSLARAQHKATPEDFIVEEKQPGHQCTVSTASDFPHQEDLEYRDGRFIAFTLVSYRMTTSAACKAVARLLNVEPSSITVAGNKDRTACTAQAAVVEIDDLDRVRRSSFPDQQVLHEQGFFIKDVRRCDSPLAKGRLEGNRFSIKLLVPGKKQALTEYLEPRMAHILAVHGDGKRPYIPNFYWRQRLGRRQNLLGVGHNLITQGLDSGIERFMCEVVEQNDHHLATKLRKQLGPMWANAKRTARETNSTVAQQSPAFLAMKQLIEQPTYHNSKPSYQPANMFIEHTLAGEVVRWKNFEEMIRRNRSVHDDVSLWVGAYQGYWYNQVLGRVLDGQIPTSALEVGGRDGELLIPLYFPGDEKSVAFYQQVCPEAIPHRIDAVVRRLFLTNPGNRRGPRRPAFITVNDLQYSVHDESVSFKFLLRSGAYATNFLSLLFDLDADVLGGV